MLFSNQLNQMHLGETLFRLKKIELLLFKIYDISQQGSGVRLYPSSMLELLTLKLKLILNPKQVEKRNDRLNRLGLTVSIFPQTPYHSSGLVFCAIGDSKSKEYISIIGKYGQSWSFDLQLGISTGGAPSTYLRVNN